MKRISKSILGVTLLEIMLVLAIAAMIIVMSVRYYQSANTSQQANNTISQIQSIAAASDSLAQATGTYSASVSTNAIKPLLPANGLTTPWGSSITIDSAGTNTYTVTIPGMPPGVCAIVNSQLGANAHFDPSTQCGAAPANFTYTYTSNV
ncbi:MAG: hypothetical protein H0W64_06005 [Gammaproteobacteria bacterium]|nr:hypothetical protein [Gammaproteobacteria bacterium]